MFPSQEAAKRLAGPRSGLKGVLAMDGHGGLRPHTPNSHPAGTEAI